MEGIRRDGLQLPRKAKSHDGQEEEMDLAFFGNVMFALLREDTAVTRPRHELFRRSARESSIWDLPEVLEEAPYEISSGSMSPDLNDTWHQGLSMSPQWEGDLELGSDDNHENVVEYEYENDEDWELRRTGQCCCRRGKRQHQ